MAYLRRKEDKFLLDWKNSGEKLPLIIKGARQIGKTETIRHFAKENYKSFIEINFIAEPVYKSIIENGYGADEVLNYISRIAPRRKLVPGQTLIFFDEIQDFPDITTTLKFFKQDGRCDVICSGSLLGIQYKNISSISVGYKSDYTMRSMDFEEFLWAKGYDDALMDDMLDHMLRDKPFSNSELEIFSGLFLDYCILGGMPNIIASHIKSNTFNSTLALQRQIITDYENDARKYAEGLDQTKIISVYRSVPVQLAKENKKFQYSLVSKGGRSKDYMGCIEWLYDAGMVNPCYCMGFPELPLKGNVNLDKYKLYMSDTGLLISTLDDEAQRDVRTGRNIGVYKGALYENFAAESLVKQGYGLYYYKKNDSTLEEDFFIRSSDELIPVEVKAGNNQAKSMKELIKSSHYPDIKHGLKFTPSNIGNNGLIFNFPFFCLFLLRRYMEKQDKF